jgi:hypothetical protein
MVEVLALMVRDGKPVITGAVLVTAAAFTVTAKLVLVLSVPSLTVSVIVAVPD